MKPVRSFIAATAAVTLSAIPCAVGSVSIYSGTFPAVDGGLSSQVSVYNTNAPSAVSDVSVGMVAPMTMQVQASVDPVALTWTYDKFVISSASFSENYNIQKTVGFGSVVNYTMSVTINPIQLAINNVGGNMSLVAGSGASYSLTGGGISSSGSGSLASPFSLSGSFTITGPTETISGTFNRSFGTAGSVFYVPNTVQTTDYPASLRVWGYGSMFRWFTSSGAAPFINQTVDGQAIRWTPEYFTFSAPYAVTMTPGALVPEPATASIFALMAAGPILRRRRH